MLNKKWDEVLMEETKKTYFKELGAFVKNEYKHKICYPKYENIFNALRYTDYDEVRVVILGQDPYHGENEAHGLAFSVLDGVRRPPSLNNIFKELYSDLGIMRTNNNLTDWTKQGVLLLNTVLTVEKDKAFSHRNHGWEIFTDAIIKDLNERDEPIIFVLWGSPARSKKEFITNDKHIIIELPHPSPLSANRGFLGSKPFSKVNSHLKEPIKWGYKLALSKFLYYYIGRGETMDKVINFLEKKLKLKDNDAVVIGVSGGPDFMALLDVLTQLKKELNFSIIVGHVNHNVRAESADEYKWLEEFCSNNSLIFEGMKIEAYGDDNFHNEARTIRYNYFESLVKKYKAKYLFTAHHADDLMETILMRIVRGSTLKGYSGFEEIIIKDGYKIVRPLISVTKDEILEYCKNKNITYFIDSSNSKDKYTRNRFRKYIIPALKEEDKNVHNKFKKFSDTLNEYNLYVDKQVDKVIADVLTKDGISITSLNKEEDIIKTRIINRFLNNIYNDDIMLITDEHVALIMKLIDSNKKNAYVSLPNGVRIVKEYNLLKFLNDVKDCSYEIEISEFVTLNNGKQIEVVDLENSDSNYVCRLDKGEVVFPLRVRTRRDGDKMLVKGLDGHKKINDIFIDNKVASVDRDTWPIVVDSNDTIVWLPGLKKSKFDKTKNEKYDIILKYY